MNLVEKSMFYKQFAALIKAGLPLTRALKILSSQPNNKTSKKIGNIIPALEKGESLTDSLFKNGFISYDAASSFKIAEENACLANVLERTAFLYEKKDKNIKELRRTLAYPTIVFASSVMSLVFLLVFILPTYAGYFAELNCKLPLVTRIALIIPNYGVLFGSILVLVGYFVFKAVNGQDLRVKLPIVGELFRASFLRDFCFLLNYQLKSGVPFVSALKNINKSIQGEATRKNISKIIRDIERGESISTAFSKHKLFDGMFLQILGIGEETGSLSDMIFEAGEHYNDICDMQVKKYASFVEPAATLLVGGVVCFTATAMLLPLFSMVNSLL